MEKGILLKDITSINAGADVTISKITKKHIDTFGTKFIKGEGVFVLTDRELKDKNFPITEKNLIKPFIKNSDIEPYYIKKTDKHLIYTNSETNIKNYPKIEEHLKKFKKITTDQIKRYEENIPWYMLHRPREEKIFLEPRIILPYRSKKNTFAYTEDPIYARRDVFFILSKDNSFDLKYLLCLLNSKIYYIWLYYRGKRKGETLEMYSTPVSNIPIPEIPLEKQKKFVDMANEVIKLKNELCNSNTPTERNLINKQITILNNKIDEEIYRLYALTEEEIKTIEENV